MSKKDGLPIGTCGQVPGEDADGNFIWVNPLSKKEKLQTAALAAIREWVGCNFDAKDAVQLFSSIGEAIKKHGVHGLTKDCPHIIADDLEELNGQIESDEQHYIDHNEELEEFNNRR